MTDTTGPSPRAIVITPTQRRVLHELCTDGAANFVIGRRLGIAEDTVKHHVKRLLKAGGYSSRTALVVDLLRGRARVRVDTYPARKGPA